MLFTKEFFSIDETLDILNKFTEGKTNLTQKYIKDLFLEEKIDLRINVKMISSYGVEFFNNKKYEVPFSLIDINNIFKNNSPQGGSIQDENFYIDLTLTEDGNFYGSGNFRIVPDNCSIIEQGRTFSILVSSFDIYASYKEYVSYDDNNKSIDTDKDLYIELYTETPILIDFKDVLIHIKSLLDTIKLINEITEHSIEYLSNINIKVKNTELEQQPEELTQKPAQVTQPPTEEEKQNRVSYPQRALFSLLLSKMYPNGDIPNTNAIKEGINEELKKIGYREISYNTIDKLLNNK
ncbi:hypothetical protein F9854_04750 [Glaesserella parasuis]|uniref:hypothetical protein n=1 Tax=Glaesserella parasuis TaxID=738 RepID=UPI00132B8CD2|nr:hypothetical protein [Glaesserella parasuis]MDG6297152.1 hypothetical protein [Glaesserella parasuis]MDO9853408.1 hypothetical protein [Glaesserella parasuis]MDO9947165.1 hypothetical protein [Glaesserella parasuis]MDO9996198.1 hypothetical protein [Glaesserella parasuis]MDP0017343.1 hypothetical protein [Glaesserella parasuis]